jgi:hypothetical protein
LDVAIVGDLMMKETMDDSVFALKVYERGAFSWPYADLEVKEGLPIEMPKGTKVTGISSFDKEIEGSVLEHASAGSTLLRVQYHFSDDREPGHECHVGANPIPNLKGCKYTMGAVDSPFCWILVLMRSSVL